jgi:hypothetical protein
MTMNLTLKNPSICTQYIRFENMGLFSYPEKKDSIHPENFEGWNLRKSWVSYFLLEKNQFQYSHIFFLWSNPKKYKAAPEKLDIWVQIDLATYLVQK